MKNHKNNPTMPVQGKGIQRGQASGDKLGMNPSFNIPWGTIGNVVKGGLSALIG